jgi:antitoxin (DNA-binding transcriptional repressor) of toxin-antitoxin stability system
VLTNQVKGAVAEQAIVLAATKLRVPVWKPVAEQGRVDLVLEIAKRLVRVQCKWGRLSPQRDVVIAKIGGSWLSPSGYVSSTYSEEEVDLFGIYCGELDRCFLLPASLLAGKHEIWLRRTPTRNGQKSCITLADDFDFDGAVAQLEERLAGSQKVRGSSPLSSTPPDGGPTAVGCDDFRVRFSYWLDRVAAGEEALVTRRGKPRIRLSPAIDPAPAALTPPAEPRTPRTAPK